MDVEDAFPVDSDEPTIRKVPSQNYKTTGEDDEGSTDTSGMSTFGLVAKPDLKRPPPNTKLLISCDSQSCFREVETVGEQTFWNVPDRVDPLDSLVGIDF